MLYNADYKSEREFANLKGIFNAYDDYKKYFEDENAPIWNEVTENILKYNPEWVGFTMYTAAITAVKILSKKIKEVAPWIKIVVGGPHATMDSELLHKLPNVDYQVKREGEFPMLALVNGDNPKNIPGVVSRSTGKLSLADGLQDNGDAPPIKPLDQLPFPDRDNFWMIPEEEKKFVDVSYLVSIRGCPLRCNFCASPMHWKRDKTQYRSPADVLKEMKHLKNNYWDRVREYDYSASNNTDKKDKLITKDNSVLYIVDDIFNLKEDRVCEILQGMIDEKLDMPFKAEMRTDFLTPKICQKLKEAKCVRAKIGMESGSNRILKQIQKDETREEILDGCKMLTDAGVPFTLYAMLGFPGETDDDVQQTISLIEEAKPDWVSLGILSPYFGTKIYYDLLKEGYELDKLPEHYFYHQGTELMVNKLISKEMLDKYLSLNEINKNSKGYL